MPMNKLMNKVRALPPELCALLKEVVYSFKFRSLRLKFEQIRALYEASPTVTYRLLAMIFGMSKSSIQKICKDSPGPPCGPDNPTEDRDAKPQKASLLAVNEEKSILQWMNDLQLAGDCPTPHQVRMRASEIYFARTEKCRDFDRSWWKRFKGRHPEVATQRVKATEGARTEVTCQQVTDYFREVELALQVIKSPYQLLNLDEVGLSTRPDKGRFRRVAYLKTTAREPTFKEEKDGSHVTMTACINLKGEALMPQLLGTTLCPCNTRELWEVSDRFFYEKTAKGRQTTETFRRYCENILKPYVQGVRNLLGDPEALVYLILDNASVHNVPDTFESIGIKPLWLPPHSSHFLQPLDLLLFAELKKCYVQLRTIATTPKVEGKVLRILRAWHKAKDPGNVIRSFSRGAILINRVPPGVQRQMPAIRVDWDIVASLQHKNCSDAER